MRRLFTYEDDIYIKEHYETTPYKELAQKFGVTERQLRGHINNMGWTKIVRKDDSFFSEINTPQKAYWLGMMYADGYISYHSDRRTYEASIELQHNDLPTLEQFKIDLGFDCTITHKESDKVFNGYSYHTSSDLLRIYSRRLCDDLIAHGVGIHKTYSKEHPIVDGFKSSFVRGFFDGDGCVYTSQNHRLNVNFTNANEVFLQYLKWMIEEECGAVGGIYQEKENKYRLSYHKSDSVKLLLDWMYSDDGAWKMERKYQKYKNFYDGLAA